MQFVVSTVELTEEEPVRKGPTYTGGFVGGTIGSFIPSLWGAGQLSLSSVVFFMIGGFVGIWIAYLRFGRSAQNEQPAERASRRRHCVKAPEN